MPGFPNPVPVPVPSPLPVPGTSGGFDGVGKGTAIESKPEASGLLDEPSPCEGFLGS
jgi:hypothetical protein